MATDLADHGEIGRGAFGAVNRMIHIRSNTEMAVKRIRSTVDEREQKQLLMDLEVVSGRFVTRISCVWIFFDCLCSVVAALAARPEVADLVTH